MRPQTHLLIVVIIQLGLLGQVTHSCKTWKIVMSSGQGVPVDWMGALLSNINAGLQKSTKEMKIPALQFGMYIRFLLEDIFPLMRYNLANRQHQIEMKKAKNEVDGFFKSFATSMGKGLGWAINLSLVQEDDFRAATYLFSLPVEDFTALGIPSLMASLMDKNYNYDSYSSGEKLGQTWAVNAFEMVHFIFQLGYHNAGLDFEFESDPTKPDSMDNTLDIAHAIFNACASRHPAAMNDGLLMFGAVLQDIYGSPENTEGDKVELLKPDKYMGNSTQEKTQNMMNFLHDTLFYYIGNEESLSFMGHWYNNPALEQFLIKGGIMITVGVAKNYLMPGIDIGDVGSETLKTVLEFAVETAADQAVDQVLEQMDIASLVATKHQKDLGLNKANIIDNAVSAFGERYIDKNYVIMDKRFTIFSQDVNGNAPTGQRRMVRDRVLVNDYRRLI